jgi:hypothetical protein
MAQHPQQPRKAVGCIGVIVHNENAARRRFGFVHGALRLRGARKSIIEAQPQSQPSSLRFFAQVRFPRRERQKTVQRNIAEIPRRVMR